MKKLLVSAIALTALAGCASYYDYYKGDIRYTQDGEDCIYYAGEAGNHFSATVRNMERGKRIVYRNTRCEDLYNRDTFGEPRPQERQILTTAADSSACPVCAAARTGSAPCGQAVLKRRYVIMPAM